MPPKISSDKLDKLTNELNSYKNKTNLELYDYYDIKFQNLYYLN